MANIRLESYEVHNAPRVNTGEEKIGRAIQGASSQIGDVVETVGKAFQQKRQKKLESVFEAQKAATDQYQKELKVAQEQQDARDRILAADKLGGVQREYTRRAKELERTFIGAKSSPEYEKQKKAIFDELLSGATGGMSDKVSKDMQKSGKTWINAQLLADLEKSYKEEAEAANAAASNYANNAIASGAAYGENGDIESAKVAFGMTRQELKSFADQMAENSDLPMKEFDANYMLSFLTGAAKSDNPELAWEMSKPEYLADFMGKDYEKDKNYFDTLSKNLRQHLEKPLEYGRNRIALEKQKEINQIKTNEALDFMNNPVIMGARLETVAQKNKFGDVSTFKDFYDMHKGRYPEYDPFKGNQKLQSAHKIYKDKGADSSEFQDALNTMSAAEKFAFYKGLDRLKESGLVYRINELGLDEKAVNLAFNRVDKLIKAGASEDDALQQIFSEFSNGRIKTDVVAKDFKIHDKETEGNWIERQLKRPIFNKDAGRPVRIIDLYKNITPEEAEEYIKNGASKTDIIRAQAEKLYENSGNVGDGSISNADLHNLMKQVAGITINENGDVDNNLIKAFMARNYIQDHNASPEQIQTFNKVIEKALTDKNFKDGIAKLANKPSFDDMFVKTKGSSARTYDKNGHESIWMGVGAMFRSKQDDMNDYVENVGRDAYIDAMALLAAGRPDDAMAYYDQKVRQAYDFVKSDIIDTEMVNRVLAAGGKPIVPVNGQMSEIVGRDNNGEYILRNTGRKVNGTF
nr:MAG TPA: hypothetical protein [Caudoviricetes sp.]